jgi:hypothetical protein
MIPARLRPQMVKLAPTEGFPASPRRISRFGLARGLRISGHEKGRVL